MHKAMTEQFHTFYRNLMLFAMPETSCQEWYYTNDVAKSFCADKVRRVCQILQDGFEGHYNNHISVMRQTPKGGRVIVRRASESDP